MSGCTAARVYVDRKLAEGAVLDLDPARAHHLRDILRLRGGGSITAFNAHDGEWLCRIEETGRNRIAAIVERLLRYTEPERDLWLLFAPIKRARLDWLVEKATELGVSALQPVWTQHTQMDRLNLDRLRSHAVAAAEQSERLSVPEVRPARTIDEALCSWPGERHLFVCDETGAGEPIAKVLARFGTDPAALLIGPEGGFAERELDSLVQFAFVTRVGLGPRVLRADTAALAALSVFQAIAGDWRHPRFR